MLDNKEHAVKTLPLLALALALCCCRSRPDLSVFVPVASVPYDGFKDGDEIIRVLHVHGIIARWAAEATKVFPILVPKLRFQNASAILQTNSLVTSGKVRLYSTITWEEKL